MQEVSGISLMSIQQMSIVYSRYQTLVVIALVYRELSFRSLQGQGTVTGERVLEVKSWWEEGYIISWVFPLYMQGQAYLPYATVSDGHTHQ